MTTHPQPFINLKRPEKGLKAMRRYCEEVDRIYNQILSGQTTFLSKYSVQELCQLRLTNYKRNLLHIAVWYQKQELLERLCSNKAFQNLLNETDINGDTPLHLSVFCKNLDAFKGLVQSGANPSLVNRSNEQPMDIATASEEWRPFLEKAKELITDPNLSRMLKHFENKFEAKNNNQTTFNTLTPTQLDIQTKKISTAETRDKTYVDEKDIGVTKAEAKGEYRNEWESFLDTSNREGIFFDTSGPLTSQRNLYNINVESYSDKRRELPRNQNDRSLLLKESSTAKHKSNTERISLARSSMQANDLKIARPQNKASSFVPASGNREIQNSSYLNVPDKSSREASFLSQGSDVALYKAGDT